MKSEDDPQLVVEGNGYCDVYAKIIRVLSEYNENAYNAIKDYNTFKAIVNRHEIIHAFLFESGMREWSEDEKLVDWLAIQFPKMLIAFEKVKV